MSLGEKAVILIRLDARRGEDAVTVAALAQHMGLQGLAAQVVVQRILELEQEGYVLSQRDAAGQVVGVRLSASGTATMARQAGEHRTCA